ncbi:hypothetical protein [Candidatus Uabimicrobium amorphum]|uniref:Pyrrolidone-carboxylate peptidase n=1 Tax=Uabimicrobium amorphum TaxID=2596890 RepID=A0A5S9F3Y5_UABAM|nr:hypothetical protein [Candidatus Uabimicrobium amorphum]BBM84962.1 pyrrolidone-carboxylate peptidase [Candidatus Uabimicrobium amorphum]
MKLHYFILSFILLGGLLAKEKNILVLGYWPPTNAIVQDFSNDAALNPGGWKGKNWQNLGYDIYSFFPTFPKGVKGENGRGEGNLEVDYQDTSRDFWKVVERIKPHAIIAFGLGRGPWEIEFNARNLAVENWRKDYLIPQFPLTKPDVTRADNFTLHSTLPVAKIAEKVNAADLGFKAWVDWQGDPGRFLCEYMAYHVMWYQSLHRNGKDACLAAGFIHVGGEVDVTSGKKALEITLQETIAHIKAKHKKTQSLLEILQQQQQKKIYVTCVEDHEVLQKLLPTTEKGVFYRYLGKNLQNLNGQSSRFFTSDANATFTGQYLNGVEVYAINVEHEQKIPYVDLKLGRSLLDD